MTTSAFIRLATPYQSPVIEDAVLSVIRSGWLVAKSHTQRFEIKLSEYLGRKHAVAVSSGTGALVAAMAALGIGPQSTVLVPAFTFPAPARAAVFLGAQVRLCDVDADTFNVSAATVSAALDESVSLVVGIDQFGAPCPAQELSEICAHRGIPLLM
ncbi:MAG: aminotransferase class I/II-fold pyridoxal phosphate-dependent enzyme, partial [Deltaproteobacteria bacterium]|nr:aminotransferase class I/II-fold pyridoxal phosphate-dependent enzyme [Deltaproteobacteria bacterium]